MGVMGRPFEEARKKAEFTLRSFEAGSLQENDMVVRLARDVLAQGRVIEQQRVALNELLGSYRALVGRADVTAEQAENWDGPVCAKRVLAAGGETETP